jgi:hypothetical protein
MVAVLSQSPENCAPASVAVGLTVPEPPKCALYA